MAIPTDVTGLLAWWKADAITGVSDGVTFEAWPDSSGNGKTTESPASTALWPSYETNEINGLPVARWSGDKVLRASISLAGTCTALMAIRPSDTTGTILRPQDGIQFHFVDGVLALTRPGQAEIGAGAATIGTGAAIIVAFTVVSATSWAIYLNGATDGSGSTSVAPGSDTYTLIGNAGVFGGDPFVGDIGEICLYSTALSTADRNAITTYLNGRWLAAPPPTPIPGRRQFYASRRRAANW